MNAFPQKDYPPELTDQLIKTLMADDKPMAPEWLEAFDAPGEAEPPAQPLTAAERIHGLAIIWSEAKFNFAYWDQLPGHDWWDQQFQRYLPLVAAEQDDRSYYQHLLRFGQLLSDGHTGVMLPRHMRAAEAMPPIGLRAVEGRPIVVGGDLLPVGAEILTVDGRPWQEAQATQAIRAHTSRPAYTEALTIARLLRGPAGSTVQVTARMPGGEIRELRLERSGALPDRPPLVVHDLGDGIRHVEVNRMDTDETWKLFDQHFPDFEGVTGLILDVRWNGGGSSAVGWRILARTLLEPTRGFAVRMRAYLPTARAWGLPQRWMPFPGRAIEPDQERPRFTGPVAILSGTLTYSAAEDFLVAAKESRRGPIIGEPSGGSTGQPLFLQLPGGGAFRVCTMRATHPDGTHFIGAGVQPDIDCAPTVSGVAAGRDEEVERAVQFIRTRS